MIRLKRDFFERDTVTVARELPGALLVREIDGKRISGRIVEVEAYTGWDDKASHAHRGITPRTKVMFGKAGISYVYFIYGMYWLFNIVAKPTDVDYGAAILIRALEPVEGLDIMAAHRTGRVKSEWANGPGKLTMAMAIDDKMSELDMTSRHSPIYVEKDVHSQDKKILSGPRIGINVPEPWKSIPWRFWLEHQNDT